jgi:hypothetical protein
MENKIRSLLFSKWKMLPSIFNYYHPTRKEGKGVQYSTYLSGLTRLVLPLLVCEGACVLAAGTLCDGWMDRCIA